jgi:hypothetical protein
MSTSSRPSLGTLGPLVLVLGLALDVGSRFVSYDRVCFRAWETLHRSASTGLGGQFEPNRHYVNDHAYGDLSSMGNYPELRMYRTEVFTTDAHGFRETRRDPKRPVGAVLVGTSFSAGSGLKNDETLSARLEDELGISVYNATGADVFHDKKLDTLLGRLNVERPTIIVETSAGAALPQTPEVDEPPNRWTRVERILGPRYLPIRAVYARVHGWLAESPLKLILFRGFKAIEDDRILPNSFAHNVIREELTNGDPVLFLRRRVENKQPVSEAPPLVEATTAVWRRWQARGIDALFVLVPSQYEIFGPLTRGHRDLAREPEFMIALRDGLSAAGVPVLDLTGPLQAATRAGLPERKYVYWRDDTHWNPAGVRVAARAIAERLRKP